MNDIFLVGAGGFLGASSRYIISMLINRYWSNSFPLATFVINMAGSFILGLAVTLPTMPDMSSVVYYGLGIGFLGSFTTFSTFGFEVLRLAEDKKILTALLYVAMSFLTGFLLAWAASYAI